ncbi:YSIRK-type signal peptide-containing protein, partial [Gemella sp.]
MKKDRKEKFSIRKFSFGAASCLIGAQIAISGVTNTVKADGITAYEANGDKVTAYAHRESVYKLRGTSTSIYNAFLMEVDTSKYTKENPIVTVTLTYNAKDNQTGSAPIFWSGRPFHWFTVPEGTEELGDNYGLTLTNGSGVTNEYTNWSSWESNSRFIHSKYKGNPDAWERHNTTTGETLRKTPFASLNSEFNKFLGDYNNSWYDNSNMPTQKIMNDLRTKSRSIYTDWEKRAAGTVTVTYTTKVKDPVNTKELTIGMGVYQELNKQQYARVETVKLPVLYKLNELFEPKVPERTPVDNLAALSETEVNEIKTKILTANENNKNDLLATNKLFKDNLKDSSNNGANSISIDKATGDATITYKDDSTDTIKGSELIYEKPKAAKPVTPSEDFKNDDEQNISYYTNPVEVENLNNISQKDRDNALKSFLKVNLTQEGYNKFENGYTSFTNDDFKPGVKFNLENGKKATFILDRNLNYIKISRERPAGTLGLVPREQLFRGKPKPTFDVATARTEAKKVIGSLDNLYPSEKTGFETRIDGATNREGIERVLNEAQSKANENAVELAKMKKSANDKINALGYLTPAEKDAAINKINSATIKQNDATVDRAVGTNNPDTDANREETKARLNKIVAELEKKNLEKAKEEAIKNINNISDENLSKAEKDKYIEDIKKAGNEETILNIVKEAQKKASDAEAARRKAEADKVRDQYKDMINQIPGLTDEEKKQYNDAIDKATSTDEMAAIVDFAKLSGERKKAVAELEKLQYLNNNQKQSFKDRVENSANKEDIENYVSQARQLNSKMKQLHDLAEKAREIKPKDGSAQDKYTTAEETKKQAFDNALEKAESVLNKQNGADETITTVGNLFTALETAINNLQPNGEKVKVNADKSALQAEYDKKDSVKNSPAYAKETDAAKKKAYDDALVEAKKILDNTDATQDAVDKALEALESARSSLTGKADEFELTKKDDKPVPISVDPAVGATNLSPEDKKLVQDKINGIPTGAIVIYKPIVEKDNKKYVPVKVTHESISKEIEIEVVQSEAAKSPLTEPKKVKVNDVNNLSKEEKTAVENAVKEANPSLKTNPNIKVTVDE